jgi:heme exporter protein B
VAAIISRAAIRGALFAVLSFPILLLPLILLVSASDSVLLGSGISEILAPLQALVAYIVVMLTASIMLFRFVWKS